MSGGGSGGHAFGGGAGHIYGRPTRQVAAEMTKVMEAELTERGFTKNEIEKSNGKMPKTMSQAQVFWLGFLCGGVVVSLPWWLFWELT